MESVELYPTVELIDRLHPPANRKYAHPIPIEFTIEDLRLAAAGNFITRVVYVEDPATAIPVTQQPDAVQPYFNIPAGEDALQVADALGRAVAIVRLGSRGPDASGHDPEFYLGGPPVEEFQGRQRRTAATVGPIPGVAPVRQAMAIGRTTALPVPFQPASRQLIERAKR